MVLIPLIVLFLIAFQLTIAIHGRNTAKISAQDAASTRAITGEFLESDTFLQIYSPDSNQNLELLVSHEERSLPSLIPGLSRIIGSNLGVKVNGIAIIEKKR